MRENLNSQLVGGFFFGSLTVQQKKCNRRHRNPVDKGALKNSYKKCILDSSEVECCRRVLTNSVSNRKEVFHRI